MKWFTTGLRTLRQQPAEAVLPGQSFLIRGGYLKKLSAGIFTYNPLLLRSIKKFENIVRNELNKIPCAEILMPMVQPKNIWVQSGRWALYKDLLQKMTSRTGQSFCLGPTHEEVIAQYVKHDIQSYKDLPLYFYQIQTKFRDEIRPRFGLMRAKEFIMKDAYSFDRTIEEAKQSYQKMRVAYKAIFSSLGVPFYIVNADSGEIGGSQSEEFHIPAEHGEEELLVTSSQAVSKNMNPHISAGAKDSKGESFQPCKGIEVGHIFYLGDKYSSIFDICYKDKGGTSHPVYMGCYGVGITRTVQAVIEHSRDACGVIWPLSIAPFTVHICILDVYNKELLKTGNNIYQMLWKQGVDVFLDDRVEQPGVKFKDADLLGLPLRIDIGARDIMSSQVGLVVRATRKKEKVNVSDVVQKVLYLLQQKHLFKKK